MGRVKRGGERRKELSEYLSFIKNDRLQNVGVVGNLLQISLLFMISYKATERKVASPLYWIAVLFTRHSAKKCQNGVALLSAILNNEENPYCVIKIKGFFEKSR